MRDLKPFITERDGVPVTTSRAVAEQSGINQRRGTVNIKGNKYSVIYIPSDKLKS